MAETPPPNINTVGGQLTSLPIRAICLVVIIVHHSGFTQRTVMKPFVSSNLCRGKECLERKVFGGGGMPRNSAAPGTCDVGKITLLKMRRFSIR